MTSKEALKDLRERIIHPEYFGQREILKELAIIEKDLEVLETLKRNLCFYGCCIDFYKDEDENINTKMNTNDYQIVKEWLENGK